MIIGQRISKETAELLGVPFTVKDWEYAYRFVRGGEYRIERLCSVKTGEYAKGEERCSRNVDKHILGLLHLYDHVLLVELG